MPSNTVIKRMLSLALAAGLALGALVLLAASASAAGRAAVASAPAGVSFTVGTTDDLPDNHLGDGLCQDTAGDHKCSLRAAIQEVNALTSTNNTIFVPAATYTLTDDIDGDLQITNDVTINGVLVITPGGTLATIIAGGPGWAHRILRVQKGAHVTLNELLITHGNVPGLNGGGLDIVSGTVNLNTVYVISNTAAHGGGIYNAGTLNMTAVNIASNKAFTDGAGIYNASAPTSDPNLTLTRSTVNDNLVPGSGTGGALYNLGNALVLSSTLSYNLAGVGGAVANIEPGNMHIEGSLLYSNTAANGAGGGIDTSGAAAVVGLVNSTVGANRASSVGGGIANVSGEVDLFNATVAENTSSTGLVILPGRGGGGLYTDALTFYMQNTLVANNHDAHNGPPDCDGTFYSNGYNLVRSLTGCTLTVTTTGDVTGVDPQLLPLGYRGGFTDLYPLGLHSPAVDAGNPGGCTFGLGQLPFDQRGQPRSVDGNGDGLARCDIGAFELQLSRLFLPLTAR